MSAFPADSADTSDCKKWQEGLSAHPVIVGDMDGSGSRGVVWLLRAGGVWMRTTNKWLDWAKDEHFVSNVVLEATHSVDYEFPQLPSDVRALASSHVSASLAEFASVAERELAMWGTRQRRAGLSPWEPGLDHPVGCPRRVGWKHGPTVFLLPVLQHLAQGFTFVHLVRDGRDMAFSRNRNNLAKYPKFGGQVVGLFKLRKKRTSGVAGGSGTKSNYKPEFNKCNFNPEKEHSVESDLECMVMQMKLWEKINLGAASYGERSLGLRYVPVRIEDLMDPAAQGKVVLLLFRRLGLDVADEGEAVETKATAAGAAAASEDSNPPMSLADAQALAFKVFGGGGRRGRGGAAGLRSHFSLERWGGCPEHVVDAVEHAGSAGLRKFGYLPWRELLEKRRGEGEEGKSAMSSRNHTQTFEGDEHQELPDSNSPNAGLDPRPDPGEINTRYGCDVGSVQIQVPRGKS